jgi:hypothetical protein
MARPTNGPGFAEGGANPSTWPSAKAANGYAANEKLPAEDFNGILENHGEWLQHLDSASGVYGGSGAGTQDLADAIANTSSGDGFVLHPHGQPYLRRFAQPCLLGVDANIDGVALCAERAYVSYAGGPSVQAYSHEDLNDLDAATPLWTNASMTGMGGTTKIVTNGTHVGVIDASGWVILDATDGTELYAGNYAPGSEDCAINASHFVFVGEPNGSNEAYHEVALSNGTVTSFSWGTGAALFGVCAIHQTDSPVGSANRYFAVAGEADGSSNTIGVVNAAAATEWRAVATRTFDSGTQLVTNGRMLFAHNGDAGGFLTCFAPYDGTEIWERGISADLPALAADVKDLYFYTDNDVRGLVIDPATGVTIARLDDVPTSKSTQRRAIAANSHIVLVGGYSAGDTEGRVLTYASGVRSRRWFRSSESPHFIQAQPEVL